MATDITRDFLGRDGTEQLVANVKDLVTHGGMIITPEMYGAVGDGVTDDSAAIHAAIQEATDTAENAYHLKPIVYLAPKTYKISTGIVLDARCSQFHCDGILQYDGTGKAISVMHSLMNIYINQIQAPNGTAMYLSGEDHMCVTNTISVNRIEGSIIGLHLYNGGEANSVFYNRINIGPIASSENCVFIEAVQGYINENHFWLGKLSGGSTGVKIYANKSVSNTGAGGNRFFKGSCEDLKDNTESTCAFWFENTSHNTFANFRTAENHGGYLVKFVGSCSHNDIHASTIPLGGVDISGMTDGLENILRGDVMTGMPYHGGYSGGDKALISYSNGITYDPTYANVSATLDASTFPDAVIGQLTTGGLMIPTTLTVSSDPDGSSYALSSIYSGNGSLARGFPLVLRFPGTGGTIILKDSHGAIILDNTAGQYAGKTVSVRWSGYDVVSNMNVWEVKLLGATFESTTNKTRTLSSASTDDEYPTAKAVFDALEAVEGTAPDLDIDETGHLVLLPNGGYTNLVPTSIDTDGSIFNDIGYQDGYRFSSSGTLKEQSGATATGFIPCTRNDIIRLKGVAFGGSWAANYTDPDTGELGAGTYCYLMLYDSSKTMLLALSYDNVVYGGSAAQNIKVTKDNDLTVFDISGYTGGEVAFIRINGAGSGANMIVTLNQEIIEAVTEDLGRIVPVHKGTYDESIAYEQGDVVYYSGASYWHFSESTTKGVSPTDITIWTLVARDGATGKTAYAYAQDGGYAGTAAEFGHKLAVPFVTPQMYGAVGDGVTDDTAAFQSALAANDNVFVPDGNYLITGTLDISYKKSLFSTEGQRATLLYNGSDSVVLLGRMSVFRNINITIKNAFSGIIFETNNQKINTGEPGLHTRVEHVVVDFENDCSATLIGLIADSGTDPNNMPRLDGFCFQTYQDIHVDNSSMAYGYGIKFETIQGRDFATSTSDGYPWINHIDFKDIALAHPHTAIKSVSTVADGLVSQEFGVGHIMFDNVYSQSYHKAEDNRYDLTRYFLDLENFDGYFTRCMPWDYHYFAWGQGITDPDSIIHIIGKNVTAHITDGSLCSGNTELVRLCRFTAEEDSGRNVIDNPEYFVNKYFPGSFMKEGYDSVDAKIDAKLTSDFIANAAEERINQILYSGSSNVMDDPLTKILIGKRWSHSGGEWVDHTKNGCTTVVIPIVYGVNVIRWSPTTYVLNDDFGYCYFFDDDELTSSVIGKNWQGEGIARDGGCWEINNSNGYKYVAILFKKITESLPDVSSETMTMTINREITDNIDQSYTEYLKDSLIDPAVSTKVAEEVANMSIPTKTSELTNDSGFITADDIPEAQVPDLSGYALKSSAETWTFTLADDTVVTKKVVLA